MPRFYNQLTSKSSLYNVLEALKDNINCNINCVKIATVESFNSEDLTVACRVNNKILIGLKKDGNQELMDYPLIYAKVHFFGWGNVGATYPIEKGMEGFLLFNDRELETWFLTGSSGNLKYERSHDLTDAIFVCGLHSKPNMIEFIADCLALYYKNSIIKLFDESIDISTQTLNVTANTVQTGDITLTGNITQTGNNVITGSLTADGVADTTAFSGTFKDLNNQTVTVENGIIKSVS